MHVYTFDNESGVIIQRAHCDIDHPELPHTHDFIELVYTSSGTGTHYINGRPYPVRHGDLLFINYHEVHAIETTGKTSFYNFLIKPEFMSANIINSETIDGIFLLLLPEDVSMAPDRASCVHFSGEERAAVDRLALDMYHEYSEQQTCYQSVLNGYMRLLFAKMLRLLLNQQEERRPKLFTEDIMRYLNTHFTEPLTLAALSDQCFYNPAYLGRVFRDVYGVGIKEYVRRRRMEYAADLLRSDPLRSIEDIATAAGYTNRTRFYRDFFAQFHVTPAAYRKDSGAGETGE